MTNEDLVKTPPSDALAHIAAALGPNAAVQAAIPPHIAVNLLEFLRRVQSTGMEAVAWVEAYQFVQKHAPQPAAPPK